MALTETSAKQVPPINRFGLTPVYTPSEGVATVDVVLVHGLNGDPQKTWTSEKRKTFWPSQLLPPFLTDSKARILTYGYDADVVSFTDGASKDRIHNHAETLIQKLYSNRRLKNATERPIIFVAHSLGGLVVKRALIYSAGIRGVHTEHLRSIFVSTYGILFMGTPHTGSNLAKWGSTLEWICGALMPSKVLDSQPQLVDALKKDNETLQVIDREFIQLTSRLHIYFFHEGKPTNLKGTLRFVVDEDSAAPTIQDVEKSVIQQDHSHMCKFENEDAPGFEDVVVALQRYCEEAPMNTIHNWNEERDEQKAKKMAELHKLAGSDLSLKASPHTDSTSTGSNTPDPSNPPQSTVDSSKSNVKDDADSSQPTSKEPYLVVPPGVGPNSLMVGMKKELRELDVKLFDNRRKDGTASVLLYGQPGAGKSHLARQYVYKNTKKFPGGIFWIICKSKGELDNSFWDIKQKAVARDSPELCRTAPNGDFLPVVKQWFDERHDWLIVFDGLVVEKDEDAVGLAEFIPDSKNTSIIYISRQRSLFTKPWLRHPQPIKVESLKEEEAKQLLFKVLRKKKPTKAEQEKASELVKKISGLPLAIEAIGSRLVETQEPLIKYKLSYLSDPTLEGTYNQILTDMLRLGHKEAWSLIHILCWFRQNIFVDMIYLGVKALRSDGIEVKSIEVSGKRDINTTLVILIRNALIERNEPDSDRESVTSSRESLTEAVDTLRLHSVVQSFCCNSLNVQGRLRPWLGYAIKLFTEAYRQADIRIKSREDLGRISDYRYFLVHAQRLWDHTLHYRSSIQILDEFQLILGPIIEKIKTEIAAREPGSSQESLEKGVFRSIFDRTSGSSSSGRLVDPPTPRARPTPLPLQNENENIFGITLDKVPSDSPHPLKDSPGLWPKFPGLKDLEDDRGYESDREEESQSHPMRQTLSEATARPKSRSRTTTGESHGGEWVQVARKQRNRRRRRDLGTFRPTPAKAQLDRHNAYVQKQSDGAKLHRRESSPAFQSLEKAHRGSQSPTSPNRVITFFQGISGGSPKASPQQPSWAKVAAGLSKPFTTVRQMTASKMERGRSRESLKGRHGDGQISGGSPLASEIVTPQPGYPTPELSQGSLRKENYLPQSILDADYSQAPLRGPNSAPLAIETNTSITTIPYLEEPDTAFQSTPPAIYSIQSTQNQRHYISEMGFPYEQTSFRVPDGYSSQPMSRDHSHQSHVSTAETEPLHSVSTFSPFTGPIAATLPNSPPIPQYASAYYHYPGDVSPRERRADGRALRKSPRKGYAIPAIPQQQGFHTASSRASSRGSEASGPRSTLPQHGPGIALTDPLTGSSSGIIVGFDASPQLPPISSISSPASQLVQRAPATAAPLPAIPALPRSSSSGLIYGPSGPGGQLQFGSQPPVSIDEARARTLAAEEKLRLLSQARRTESETRQILTTRAYPDVNLIPTGSELGGAVLEGMVDSDVSGGNDFVRDVGESRGE